MNWRTFTSSIYYAPQLKRNNEHSFELYSENSVSITEINYLIDFWQNEKKNGKPNIELDIYWSQWANWALCVCVCLCTWNDEHLNKPQMLWGQSEGKSSTSITL